MSTRRQRAESRKRSKRRLNLVLGALALMLVVGVGLWLGRDAIFEDGSDPLPSATDATEDPSPEPTPEPSAEPEPEPTPEPEPEPVSFTLVMAGDVLPHAAVNRNAQQPDGSYDYVPMMENVRPYIEGADIALCSLEVPVKPAGEQVTAYPVFGAPDELITSLKDIGWDGCATASNHSLDRGRPGLYRTIDVIDEVGIGRAGTGFTTEEAATAQLYEVERDGASFTVAHISATTFHNDYANPADYADVLMPLYSSAENVIESARAAREAGADFVVFTPHWGQEYWKEPDTLQREISSAIASSGEVDVILGGHAHVPQPMELYDGGPDDRGMWVAYSMGNFLSNQDEKCCNISTSTGMMPRVTIVVDDDDVYAEEISWLGVMVDTDGGQILSPIQDLLDGERSEGLTLSDATINARWEAMVDILGTELYDPSPPNGGATVTLVPRER